MSAETELLYEFSELKRKLAKAREALKLVEHHGDWSIEHSGQRIDLCAACEAAHQALKETE